MTITRSRLRARHGYRIQHLEYSKITPYVYIGTTICCRYHFEKLLSLGVRADIDLQEEKEDKPSGVDAFLWLPTADYTAPSQVQLRIGVHFIDDLIRHKMRCYVHCNAGHGRAPLLVAAYLIYSRKMGPREALRFIKKNRPAVYPNQQQLAALWQYYRGLHNHHR